MRFALALAACGAPTGWVCPEPEPDDAFTVGEPAIPDDLFTVTLTCAVVPDVPEFECAGVGTFDVSEGRVE